MDDPNMAQKVSKEKIMTNPGSNSGDSAAVAKFDEALKQLTLARQSDPKARNSEVLAVALTVMAEPDGLNALSARVAAMESKGLFANTDWGKPAILQPALAARTLRQGAPDYTAIEALLWHR
ncbi:hypothetical protein [Marinobacter sp.]|uniref:hypothetical protein n=1 Tax=Marinobacter sp. TaxID=50741 RepID=UPI0034A3E667